MDWIEKLFGKKTLQKKLILYICIAAVAATVGIIFMGIFFERWEEIIIQVNRIARGNNPHNFKMELIILQVLKLVFLFICVFGSVVTVSYVYYKRNLQEPLELLKKEMEHIGQEDLSFDCSYVSGDEMEEVCNTMNHMRRQLIQSKKRNWEVLENQRNLNAAFAHDLRTPLTVMRGYTQMLLQFYPQGKISQVKLMETLQKLEQQTERIERFSNTMKEIHTMEEYQVKKEEVSLNKLVKELENNVAGIIHTQKIKLLFQKKADEQTVRCDSSLIQEVTDNLLLNAVRYAKKEICISIYIEETLLYIYVKDDGAGFSKKALAQGMRPYFTTDSEHFGLGLTICQTLCKKHGGSLELINSLEGGAIASASFYIK